jgi:AraC family transcriptional regulator
MGSRRPGTDPLPSNRTSSPLSISLLCYQPGTRLPRHHHTQAVLSLTLEGSQRDRVGPHAYDCTPNTAVLKGAGIEHSNHVGTRGTRGLFVEIPADTEATLCDAIGAPLGVGYFADEASRHLVRRIGQELRLRQAGTSFFVEGLLFELLGTLVRTKAADCARDMRVRRAVDYLEANYRRRITCAEVAEYSGVHPSFLAQLFRKGFGMSMGEWVRMRRLEFAREALRDAATPISWIALDAGFADQSHLTRSFQARFGITPARYRLGMGGAR